MRNTKQALRDSIRKQEQFEGHLADIERWKKKAVEDVKRRPDFAKLTAKERKENTAYATAAKEISEEFTGQLDALRYRLAEIFEERRRKDLPDYDIFMAIAEDIGYDATGRNTKTNELEPIAKELSRFIQAIEEGKA